MWSRRRPTAAGQACEEKLPSAEEMRQSFTLALKVREALDKTGAQVVILGRAGQDLSKYGLRYSHAGIIWRDHPEGRWLALGRLGQHREPALGLAVPHRELVPVDDGGRADGGHDWHGGGQPR